LAKNTKYQNELNKFKMALNDWEKVTEKAEPIKTNVKVEE
jgi:hypothetical protein